MDVEDASLKMRRIARWKARKVSRDDAYALADDMEMAGWIGYLESDDKEDWKRWKHASRAMADCWCEWRFQMRFRSRKQLKLETRRSPEQIDGLPGLHLRSGDDPEGAAIARDLMEKMNRSFGSRFQKTQKYGAVLKACLLEGRPIISAQTRRELGLGKGRIEAKKTVIQQTYLELAAMAVLLIAMSFAGTAFAQTSPDGTVVPPGRFVIDSKGQKWELGSGNGKSTGAPDYARELDRLAYCGGVVYGYNTPEKLWYRGTSGGPWTLVGPNDPCVK